jgi:hypothetical protein
MDGLVRLATAVVFALTALCFGMAFWMSELRSMFAAAALLAVVIAIGRQIAPKRLEVTDDSLVIVRGWPFRNILISLNEITGAERVKLSMLTMRSFGVGGLFSHSGRFWGSGIGSFYGGITSVADAVLITAGEKVVISPEDPDQFVADMQSKIRRSRARR